MDRPELGYALGRPVPAQGATAPRSSSGAMGAVYRADFGLARDPHGALLELGAEVGAADQQIVHRDVKPQNRGGEPGIGL